MDGGWERRGRRRQPPSILQQFTSPRPNPLRSHLHKGVKAVPTACVRAVRNLVQVPLHEPRAAKEADLNLGDRVTLLRVAAPEVDQRPVPARTVDPVPDHAREQEEGEHGRQRDLRRPALAPLWGSAGQPPRRIRLALHLPRPARRPSPPPTLPPPPSPRPRRACPA